jgi:ribonucleotide reductase alpha subunit
MHVQRFKNSFAETIFRTKYAQGVEDTWDALAERLVEDVCGSRWGKDRPLMSATDRDQLTQYIKEQKFIPGGRYLWYAGRGNSYFNNCFLLRAEEDTREEWASLTQRSVSCLMTGGGIGIDYSILRPKGKPLSRTGGLSSGPIPLMQMINEVGRGVMQGGSRRSAIYASLNWLHEDIPLFLQAKNWSESIKALKSADFNFPASLDMTNISVNYDDKWLYNSDRANLHTFVENCRQAMMTGEPGFSFNFGEKQNETLRNAPLGPDTYVLTIDGYKQIRDIVGTTVKVWTGKQWANTVFNKTMENAPVVRVLMSGGREIVAEPSHEFFLEDGTKKSAKDLQEGDNLLVQLNNEGDSFLCNKYYSLGYIYGDGTFHRAYPRAEVTFCTDESRDCFENFDKGLLTSWNFSDSRGYLRAYTKNNDLFANRNKAVFPEDLFGQPAAEQCSFLAGLFDADGNYVAERGTVRVASMHVEFLHGVRRLLESLGILSGISTAGVSTYGGSQGYMLTVYSEYTSRFAEIIPTKRLKVSPYESYRKAKIKVLSVEDAGYSDVYCCDVRVEEHAFMAEGVIVSNCTEVTSEDDSDVCNLGSINISNITSMEEFESVVELGSKFLVCGTLRADLPYDKVYKVREKNRRLGLGIMGIHAWLLQRGSGYEVTPELHKWLGIYERVSERAANEHCDRLFISRPVAYRAIAPTGSIGILAGTTTGIEPLFAVAYKRRYLTDGTKWKYEFVVDSTADQLIKEYGLDPNKIDTAYGLSHDYERRIKFQADIQDYVDMSISSTINLPSWGSKGNREEDVEHFAQVLSKYAPRLRGFTCYPDGSRGGQPLTEVPYEEAIKHKGITYEENSDRACVSGVCGI